MIKVIKASLKSFKVFWEATFSSIDQPKDKDKCNDKEKEGQKKTNLSLLGRSYLIHVLVNRARPNPSIAISVFDLYLQYPLKIQNA